jgi:hypothetical protein
MLVEVAALLAFAVQDTTVVRPGAPVWGANVTAVRELRIVHVGVGTNGIEYRA